MSLVSFDMTALSIHYSVVSFIHDSWLGVVVFFWGGGGVITSYFIVCMLKESRGKINNKEQTLSTLLTCDMNGRSASDLKDLLRGAETTPFVRDNSQRPKSTQLPYRPEDTYCLRTKTGIYIALDVALIITTIGSLPSLCL